MLKQSLNRWWLFSSIALVLLLIFLTREVMTTHGFVYGIDVWFEDFLPSIRTPFLLTAFHWITFLGNSLVVIGIAGFVGISLLFYKVDGSYLLTLAVILTGAAISDYCIKMIVGRARPTGLIQSVTESSFSFPSGHSVLAVSFYGFIAFILCELYPKRTKIVITSATAIILLIGFSRLYLGVHFPSDVVAGYILGGLWLLAGIAIKNKFQSASRFSNYATRQ